MLTTKVEKKLNILDFDIENRPLAYLGPDFTTAEITAIAWSWVGESAVHCVTLTRDEDSYRFMLKEFVKAYDRADVVTGHYIREHDLPIINGALLELKLPPLKDKATSDTKLDLAAVKYLSKSQENLAVALGVPAPKFVMSNADWREANRLTKKGLALTRKRVTADVTMHKLLRLKLIELGYLGPSVVWRA